MSNTGENIHRENTTIYTIYILIFSHRPKKTNILTFSQQNIVIAKDTAMLREKNVDTTCHLLTQNVTFINN